MHHHTLHLRSHALCTNDRAHVLYSFCTSRAHILAQSDPLRACVLELLDLAAELDAWVLACGAAALRLLDELLANEARSSYGFDDELPTCFAFHPLGALGAIDLQVRAASLPLRLLATRMPSKLLYVYISPDRILVGRTLTLSLAQ